YLPDAVREAVRKACRDDRFGHVVVAADLDAIGVELWIKLDHSRLANDPTSIRELLLGWHGVKIVVGKAQAYYKPSVAITSSARSPQMLLEKLCKKAGLPETAWLAPDARLERSTWLSVLECPERAEGFVLLHKLRSLPYRTIEPEQIRFAVKLS